MNIVPTILKVLSEEGEALSYVTSVEGSWFAVSMLSRVPYCFEIQDDKFADYVYTHGDEILLEEVPSNVLICFMATYITLAEQYTFDTFNQDQENTGK